MRAAKRERRTGMAIINSKTGKLRKKYSVDDLKKAADTAKKWYAKVKAEIPNE